MRRLLCLFSLLCWLLCVPAMAEETPSVRIIDRIADPAAEPDFSFDGDAPLLEMIFPQVLNADAHAAALRRRGHPGGLRFGQAGLPGNGHAQPAGCGPPGRHH